MSTDGNKRDVFTLVSGTCGHRWVVPSMAFIGACAACGDVERGNKHVVTTEPISVDLRAVRDKLRAMSEPRDAAAVLLAARRHQRAEEAELES